MHAAPRSAPRRHVYCVRCGQKGENRGQLTTDLPSHVKAQIERNRWKFARKSQLYLFSPCQKENRTDILLHTAKTNAPKAKLQFIWSEN